MKDSKQRLTAMLEQDKGEINEPTRAAAIGEFSDIADEYFERNGGLSLAVRRGRGGYEVTVSFHATRIKNFTALK